jgi:hypothetical protein
MFKNPLQSILNRSTTNPDPSRRLAGAATVAPLSGISVTGLHPPEGPANHQINSRNIFVDDLPIRDPLDTMKRTAIYARQVVPGAEVLSDLRRAVEDRGDTIVASFADDGRIVGRGKYAGWNALVSILNDVDEVAIPDAGHLPGRTVADLLKLLVILHKRGVGLIVSNLRIETAGANFDLLDLVKAYRSAKLSQAIRSGQAKAVAAGKRIGRPIVPVSIQAGIRNALADGSGVRPTARRFNVSPASVINIRRSMTSTRCISHPDFNSRDCRDDLVA